jgi:Peptidase family M1 domain
MGRPGSEISARQNHRLARAPFSRRAFALPLWLLLATASALAYAPDPQCPQTTGALYSRIRSVPLDPQRVYRIRDASIDRPNLHIDFDDGTLAFTEDICGQITGAFFEGEGEIRLRPPNRMERGSLALFTGMAILEEQFTSGYLRFNDDTAAALNPYLSPLSDRPEFTKQWNDAARQLAEFDALRLLLDFSHFLPSSEAKSEVKSEARFEAKPGRPESAKKFLPLLHAHLLGKKLGAFEVFLDAASSESLWAGQPKVKDGFLFFDIWTSFAPGPAAPRPANDASISGFRIRASVQPPTTLRATTEVNLTIHNGGERTLLFELSQYLKVDRIEADGRALDFIQNPAIEGTQLQRRGNDLVAVVFPAPLPPAQDVKLRFSYAGEVLSEAGNGLLYVGERGTWYPNFGINPAQFDMEFRYPADWTLVATGKRLSSQGIDEAPANPAAPAVSEKVSRWISERPIPVAGFNLGKYVRAEAKAGNILVQAYGTRVVEKSFPKAKPEIVQPFPEPPGRPRARSTAPILVVPPPPPSPARDAQAVADKAAKAITNFSRWFGPYPFDSLSLTQMPGDFSQGWPSLVFLSSFAFLSPREQSDLRLDPLTRALDNQVLVHETAHQWWGDLVLWKSYRDQWIAEGLANYASLLMLEQENPVQFQQVLEKYRRDLLNSNKDGEPLRDAGPVTLGQRLQSSHFPRGYEEISYERGTWLFHMLRCMLRDSSGHNAEGAIRRRNDRLGAEVNAEEPFFRALRKIRERYAGKTISTQELLQVIEEDLPRPLWYEKRPKLDWFLEGWINGTAIPRLQTRDIRLTEKNGVTTVTGMIVQKDAPEDLVTAVPVYAKTALGTLIFLGEVLADGAETSFHFVAPSEVRTIVLDPRQTILAAPK